MTAETTCRISPSIHARPLPREQQCRQESLPRCFGPVRCFRPSPRRIGRSCDGESWLFPPKHFFPARCIATTEAPEIPYWLPSKRAVYASAALLRPVLAFSFDMRTGSELAQPVFPTPSEAAEKIDSKRFQVA